MTRTRKNEIAITLLKAVGLTGALMIGAVCPNLLQLLKPYARKSYPSESCLRTFKTVDAKGWIMLKEIDKGVVVRLTRRGLAELSAYEIGEKKLKNKGRWDKKWHLLAFDIEEKRRHLRDGIRKTLRSLGFHRLQDSVWVYPYDCRQVLELLRVKYGVRHEALYLRVDHLDNDRWLRRHFGLKA